MATQKTKQKKPASASRKVSKPTARRPAVNRAPAKSAVRAPAKPAAKKPVARKPVLAKKPAAKIIKKTVAKPAQKKVLAKKPVTAKLAVKKPAVLKPAAKPVAAKPVAAKAPVAKAVNPAVQKMRDAALKAKTAKAEAAKIAAARTTAKPVPVKAETPVPQPAANGNHIGHRAPPKPVLPPVQMSKFSTTTTPVKSAGNSKIGYKVGEHVVYPTHGVGQISAIEEQTIAGLKLELFVVFFAKDRMTLRVPVGKIASVGMRKISDAPHVAKSLETLKGRPRIKRTMWSRRAQEYEAKINSGDLIAVAEVVRDLFRADTQPEQSYSERQLFEAALDRMVREIAVVNKVSDNDAQLLIENTLKKAPRRTRTGRDEAEDNVVALKADNDDAAASGDEAAA